MPALDALRGVAALAVVWFHLYHFSALPEVLNLPLAADVILRHGFLGVEAFFVLSGVVIALSISGNRITWAYAGRFALRRSIRLDPPYWAILSLASGMLVVTGKPPALGSFAAHVLYLQNILGYRNIVSMFWTLCYEIQFYLVLVLLVGISQRAGPAVRWLLAIGPLLVSLSMLCVGAQSHGWFIDRWYAFAFGAATTGMLTGRLRAPQWGLLSLALFAIGVVTQNAEMLAVAVSGTAIGMAGIAGKLATWTGGRILQWLGRISYSLYLSHFIAAAVVKQWSGRVHSSAGGALVFLAGTAIALFAAELLHRIVEQPAQKWSRRIAVRPPVRHAKNAGAVLV